MSLILKDLMSGWVKTLLIVVVLFYVWCTKLNNFKHQEQGNEFTPNS
jgi:hypothetical protein